MSKKYENLRILDLKDTEKAARCLLEAFETDSLALLLGVHFDCEATRKYCELKLYESYVRQHIIAGLAIGVNESETTFETVALWSLPDSIERGLESFSTLMKSGYDVVWNIYGDEGRAKIFDGMLPLLHDSCERILASDSRFHNKKLFTLVYLGSTKAARGKGNARKVFEFMFENYIDVCPNNLAYLESSSPTNIPIYNKFGFHFVQNIVLGEKTKDSVEGKDFAEMNVMIRGTNGHDWTKDATSPKL